MQLTQLRRSTTIFNYSSAKLSTHSKVHELLFEFEQSMRSIPESEVNIHLIIRLIFISTLYEVSKKNIALDKFK